MNVCCLLLKTKHIYLFLFLFVFFGVLFLKAKLVGTESRFMCDVLFGFNHITFHKCTIIYF